MMPMIVGSAASGWSYAEPYLGAREPIIVVIDRQRQAEAVFAAKGGGDHMEYE